MTRYRLAIFDFDGTLVDTRRPILIGIHAALETGGFDAPGDDDILALVGLPLEEIFPRLAGRTCSDAEIERMSTRYRARFSEVVAGRTELFPGVPEMLGSLRDAGLSLAVATSRGKASLEGILRVHRIFEAFSFLASGSCVERPKPHPEMLERVLSHYDCAPADAVMVGDTTYDLRMGRAAGTDTCAVTWGMHDRSALAGEAPTHLVERAVDLAAVLGAG